MYLQCGGTPTCDERFAQKAYSATGSVDLFRVHLSKERCSSSGVTKISIAQNINVLRKRLTPLLAVLISTERAGAERGVPLSGGYDGKEVYTR